MATVKWDQSFSPAEASRGSWIPIDSSTLTELPSTSRGRYAQITYNIGSDPGSPGAVSGNPSFVSIVDDTGAAATITEDIAAPGGLVNALNVRIAESVTTLSALSIDATGISGLAIQASVKYPDTTIYESVSIAPTSISTIDFGRPMLDVEFYNTDPSLSVYVGFNSVSLATLSAEALPLTPESYYSIAREGRRAYIGNVDASNSVDVRVIGHYRNI